MLNVVMPNVVMLSVIMLIVVMLNVVVLSVVAPEGERGRGAPSPPHNLKIWCSVLPLAEKFPNF
jgi:hypothetical protein